jgi:hypothetical protein
MERSRQYKFGVALLFTTRLPSTGTHILLLYAKKLSLVRYIASNYCRVMPVSIDQVPSLFENCRFRVSDLVTS